MRQMLTEEQDIIYDAWQQFGYKTKRGIYAGGLSALEYIEMYLKEKKIINSLGNFNQKQFRRFN